METTQERRDYLKDYVSDIEGDAEERMWLLACIRDADRLAEYVEEMRWLQHQHDNALGLIRMRGVPESRAKYLPQALDVLLTRLDREIQALSGGTRMAEDRLAAIEREVQSLADLFEQEWLRSGKTDRVSRSLADKLRAVLDPEGHARVPEAVRSLLHRRNWSRVYIGVPRMKLELTLSEDEFERIQGMLASSGLRYGY